MTLLPLPPSKFSPIISSALALIMFVVGAYVGIKVEATQTRDAIESLTAAVRDQMAAHEILDETKFAAVNAHESYTDSRITYVENNYARRK